MHTASVTRQLSKVVEDNCERERYLISHREGKYVYINQQKLINFCSNDYLNLSQHPDVIAASIQGTQTFGTGSTASALVSGFTETHFRLEKAFADFLECDAAMLFSSGYHANLGVITTFSDRHSTIISDKHCHASLIDGVILSRAKHIRFPHQDIELADFLLKKHAEKDKLLLTESVFSMQGNISDINRLSSICRQNNAKLLVDDAHGIGVLGTHGKGILEHARLTQNDISWLIAPLGKAFGSQGALVAGKNDMIKPLLQLTRSYRYTTALNPAAAAAALAALTIIKQENWRREKLKSLSTHFLGISKTLHFSVTGDEATPIKSILIGDNKQTLLLQKKLMAKGLFVSCIRPPTVPNDSALIRITLTVALEESDITYLLNTIAECLHE